MNKAELVKAIAKQAKVSQATVRDVLSATDLTLAEALARGEQLPSMRLLPAVHAHVPRNAAPPNQAPKRRTRQERQGKLAGLPNIAASFLVPDLHDPATGRLDAKRIAAYFAVSVKALASALGREYAAIAKTPHGMKLQPHLGHWERIAAPFQHFEDPRTALRMWLNAPHPDLADETPLSYVLAGHAESIADLVLDQMLGQPG